MAKPKQKKVILMLPKNIGAIQISNDLTLIERKIMNIILWNAFNVEKDNITADKSFSQDNKKFYSISISHIESVLGYENSKHRAELKNHFLKLVETSLRYNILHTQKTDNGKWDTATSLLSQVTFDEQDNEVYYAFSDAIKDIVIKPTLYGWINLETQKQISSKYTLALLEYLEGSIAITKRTETKTEYIAIDDYTQLIAGSKCTYDTFKYINQELIKSPLKELNDKTDLTAKANFKKSGRKVVSISFDVKKDEYRPLHQTLELDFNTSHNEQEDILNDIQDKTHKETETSQNTHQNTNNNTRKINELMIAYNISEKKRKEFLQSFSSEYIEENIRYFSKQKQWKDKPKEIPPALIVKSIEDNYANYGIEKEEITLRQKYILELREILNPFVDKTGKRFLRNILQDYQIYKERRDKEQIERTGIRLKESFSRMDFLKHELLKFGYNNENEIVNEIGIKSDEDFKRILFYSKEELDVVRVEVESF